MFYLIGYKLIYMVLVVVKRVLYPTVGARYNVDVKGL